MVRKTVAALEAHDATTTAAKTTGTHHKTAVAAAVSPKDGVKNRRRGRPSRRSGLIRANPPKARKSR
ncbi:hypothetical protein ACFSNO_27865 [Streptomyces cirratus]